MYVFVDINSYSKAGHWHGARVGAGEGNVQQHVRRQRQAQDRAPRRQWAQAARGRGRPAVRPRRASCGERNTVFVASDVSYKQKRIINARSI
jgi:hypothetical protein